MYGQFHVGPPTPTLPLPPGILEAPLVKLEGAGLGGSHAFLESHGSLLLGLLGARDDFDLTCVFCQGLQRGLCLKPHPTDSSSCGLELPALPPGTPSPTLAPLQQAPPLSGAAGQREAPGPHGGQKRSLSLAAVT